MPRRVVSAIAFILAAFALQRACTLPWGEGTTADGATLRLSVVGLSRLGDDATLSRLGNGATTTTPAAAGQRVDCRWWPVYGDRTLCAVRPGEEEAHRLLRRAYPLLQVAMWLSVAALLLLVVRLPRQPAAQAALAGAICALSALGTWSLRAGARDGLNALVGATLAFNGWGHHMAVAAVALSALSAILLATERTPWRTDA